MAEINRGQFTVEIDGVPGRTPDAAVNEAAALLLRGEKADGSDDIESAVTAKGVRHARLYKLSRPEDAEDWALLRQKHYTLGTAQILNIRELVSGTDYAQFVEWLEFPAPVEEIRRSASEEKARLLARIKEESSTPEVPEKPKRARRAKKPALIEADLPPTHEPLEDPK